MNYADAIYSLEQGQGLKRPRWRGYIKKVNVAEDGSYDLVFVKADKTEVVFHVNANGTQTAEPGLIFDADFNSDMMSNDWVVGDAEDFKTSLEGSGSGQF